MAIVGERLSASVNEKAHKSVETSEVKPASVAANLNNDDEPVDKVAIMRKFLSK